MSIRHRSIAVALAGLLAFAAGSVAAQPFAARQQTHGASVLDARTTGPLILVRLPFGTYAVDVAWNGAHRQTTVEIGEQQQHLRLEFPGSRDAR